MISYPLECSLSRKKGRREGREGKEGRGRKGGKKERKGTPPKAVSVGENVEKRKIRTLVYFWWAWKMVQPLWKTVWRSPYDPRVSFLGIHPKEVKES